MSLDPASVEKAIDAALAVFVKDIQEQYAREMDRMVWSRLKDKEFRGLDGLLE